MILATILTQSIALVALALSLWIVAVGIRQELRR